MLCVNDQQRLWRAIAYAMARLSLRCRIGDECPFQLTQVPVDLIGVNGKLRNENNHFVNVLLLMCYYDIYPYELLLRLVESNDFRLY